MARDLVIGNGSMLLGFDSRYRIADLYYPHVGLENHTGDRFRFGLWADDTLSWLDDDRWQRSLQYLRETNVTDVQCVHEELGIRIRCHDAVDAEKNVFVRKIVVRNLRDQARQIKLFLHHDFNLYGSAAADTAMFDPDSQSLIHYKSKRYFLINVEAENRVGVEEYACGRSADDDSEGTWRDAEDGALSMNAVQQGAVDSTAAFSLSLEAGGTVTAYYWICAGKRYGEVRELDSWVRSETPARIISRTASLWYTWVNKTGEDLHDLPEEIVDLYKRSILTVRTHCDHDGGIVAAVDSDIELGHNDHYAYIWPRDAAFVSDAMDRAGFHDVARRFLTFAHDTISSEGYFLHKYTPEGSLAPSWNPWVRNGEKQLPIQEDETALVLWLLARHYDRTRDLDFVRSVYQRLIVQPADFLLQFRDPDTHLPLPSFDIWEERQGVFTFTCATVCAALEGAAEMVNLFNDQERRTKYLRGAAEIRNAVVRHLWLEREKRFARGLVLHGDQLELDRTVDSSVFATFFLGLFPAESAMVEGSMRAVRESLWVPTGVGGSARYELDPYQREAGESGEIPGNPWILCTLWLAEHAVAQATTAAQLQSALDLIRWVRSKAGPSLLLPEQVHPRSGAPLSVSPFTWSHAQLISVIRGYLEKLRSLRRNPVESAIPAKEKVAPDRGVDKPASFS